MEEFTFTAHSASVIMAAYRPNIGDILFSFSFFCCQFGTLLAAYSIEYQTVSDCKTGVNDNFHQLFDISQMQCRNCAQNSTFQTVSFDGKLTCIDLFPQFWFVVNIFIINFC